MELFDAIFVLDRQYTFLEIRWFHDHMKQIYGPAWEQYLGQTLGDAFEFKFQKDSGSLEWKDEKFSYYKLKTENRIYFFLKGMNQRRYLYEHALDRIPYAISIYDQAARLTYINEEGRKLWQIPDYTEIDGKHLLDLFEVDEEFSTVLTTLKTGVPVINRIDDYASSTGVNVLTTNTGYPIKRGGQIVGSVVLEQDIRNVNVQLKHLENVRKRIMEHTGHNSRQKAAGYTFDDIIGHGSKLMAAVNLAKKIAHQDCNILLVGETGTGKEIFAQSIHKASLRSQKNFVAVNCAAFPDTLIESLLFGTQKGSFTGSTDKAGFFEEANGGTLFLDELNSMSLSMQSKILRVIQEGTFRRVGGQKEYSTDVRIIASCNEDPFRLISENLFRKDLFYRISTVMIELPALRDHIGDIRELVQFYVAKKSHHYAKRTPSLSPEVYTLFAQYSWPGNVRELYHVLDYALNVVEGDVIELSHLPAYLRKFQSTTAPAASASRESLSPEVPDQDLFHSDLQTIMDRYEEKVIRQVLEHHGYNISRTAEALRIRRQSLQYRIKKLGIII